MKYFEITVLAQGKKQIKNLKAETKSEAMSVAQTTFGGTIMKVKETTLPPFERFEEIRAQILEKFIAKKVNTKEYIVFLRQIAVMVNAGIPLRDAIFESTSASEDKFLKNMGREIIESIDSGLGLTESFRKYEKTLGTITISMVELGEQTGSLAESLKRLSEIIEEIEDNKAKISKAMRMPIISLGAMAAAFVTLIILVVPKFEAIFRKLGGDLPLPTRLLIGAEYVLTNYGHFILILLIAVFIAAQKAYRNRPEFKLRVDEIVLKTYLIGSVTTLGMYSRYMMILAELIKAGIPLGDALKSAGITIENSFIKTKLESVVTSIQRGHSLAESLDQTSLFENMTIQMIKAGESGGELDTMLEKIAEYYKSKFQNIIDNISTMIEPLLMGVISVMVLILALGIFLPMWELSSVAMGG